MTINNFVNLLQSKTALMAKHKQQKD